MRLPFDASGFAPSIRRWSVRSMSGIGMLRAQPIGIGFELLQRRPLRAQKAMTEDVVAVASHERDVASLEAQLEPARRFAQGAGPVDGSSVTVRRRHAT